MICKPQTQRELGERDVTPNRTPARYGQLFGIPVTVLGLRVHRGARETKTWNLQAFRTSFQTPLHTLISILKHRANLNVTPKRMPAMWRTSRSRSLRVSGLRMSQRDSAQQLVRYCQRWPHPGPQICVAIEISVAISTVAIDYVVITHFVIYMLQLY